MPSLRTEASELAVAFGILGLNPQQPLDEHTLQAKFQGSLSASKYDAFLSEYAARADVHPRMHIVGRQLRANEPLFSQADSLKWAGPNRQASTATASADLVVANTPVSVKAGSNVVANPSPHNLIINLPAGQAFSQNEANWYIVQDLPGFQALYEYVQGSDSSLTHLPPSVENFETKATSDDRDRVQEVIRSYTKTQRQRFADLYLAMCHAVAANSAATFGEQIAASFASRSKTAVIEILMRWFFRLDSVSYLLCGIDAGGEFAVRIPSVTRWKSQWSLDAIAANPDLARGQSVVDFELKFTKSDDGTTNTASFHTELRWSHGRFCGSPEAKLYKEFQWSETPFFERLL